MYAREARREAQKPFCGARYDGTKVYSGRLTQVSYRDVWATTRPRRAAMSPRTGIHPIWAPSGCTPGPAGQDDPNSQGGRAIVGG